MMKPLDMLQHVQQCTAKKELEPIKVHQYQSGTEWCEAAFLYMLPGSSVAMCALLRSNREFTIATAKSEKRELVNRTLGSNSQGSRMIWWSTSSAVFSFAEGPVDIFSMLPNQGRKRGHWPWRPKRLNDPGAGSNVARLVLISIFQVDVFFFLCAMFIVPVCGTTGNEEPCL